MTGVSANRLVYTSPCGCLYYMATGALLDRCRGHVDLGGYSIFGAADLLAKLEQKAAA